MVSISVACVHCGSESVVRNGHARNGKQMYKCRSCGRNSRESPRYEKYTPEQKETILRAYMERPSMRGIERIFGVSRPTLSDWLKKRPAVASADEFPQGAGNDASSP